MTGAGTRIAVRLTPVVFVLTAVGLWFADVHGNSGYVVINTLPLFVLFALSAMTLWRGDGRWTGSGYKPSTPPACWSAISRLNASSAAWSIRPVR